MPDIVARCNQPWPAASTEAVHDTGCEQFPFTLSVSICAGGFDCSRVATKVRRAGATCNTQGCGAGVGVGVTGTTVGVPGATVVDGTGVPGAVVGTGVLPGRVPGTVA